ncbi:MAG TPA: type I DNA topoisomerase, partial [Gemmatimonadales bacterium]
MSKKKSGEPNAARRRRAAAPPEAPPEAGLPEAGEAPERGGSLVIVESPTKAKTIGKYLGRGFTVKATVGHIRDLPPRKLGVDVENGFTPEYVTIKEKAKTLAEIKRAAKGADRVLIATDPDREGEAIAWHVASQLGNGGKVRRVLFHEITKDAVSHAIANPLDIDQKKVDAQQARRILDRLVGYKASPLLWKSIKSGLSAGRVQTVALRLICEREEEIRKFVAQEYWTIEAELEKDGQAFQARLHKLDGHKPDIKDEASAQAIVADAATLPFVVTDVTRKERRRNPPAPFITSTLQQEAAKQLGFSAKRTMRAAQGLYEGVEMGAEGPVGLITYMRTDSVRVADSAIVQAREYIAANYDTRYLPATPNVHVGKKGASRVQDAHEAIRPTEVVRRPEDVKPHLESDQFKLYQLVWRRFVASQMTPELYELTTVDFDLGRYLFRATGSVVLFNGYRVLFHEGHEPEEAKSGDEFGPIPPMAKGDRPVLRRVVPSQHFTEPPPRYSQASLVKALEEKGIGRPSTYATIIGTLQSRWYATTKERRFSPTPLGEKVWKVMRICFPEVFEVGFTAQMESELDKVEEGDLAWQHVLGEFWGPFNLA